MRVRTTDELVDRLAGASAHRKQELITLKESLASGRPHLEKLLRRTAVVMSYAHWEGFVKEAAIAYVELISHDPPPLERLTVNFQAVVCRELLQKASAATKRIQPHVDVVQCLFDSCGSKAQITPENAIDTESNLNADVLRNICLSIGISYEPYWIEVSHFVDDLVLTRCAIAHGELNEPEHSYAIEVIDFTLLAIDIFKTDVENAALLKAHLRPIPMSH